MDPVITAAIITAVGGILAALIIKVDRGVERIKGLINGRRDRVIREIEDAYRERLATGKVMRRHLDKTVAEQQAEER